MFTKTKETFHINKTFHINGTQLKKKKRLQVGIPVLPKGWNFVSKGVSTV